MGDEEAEMTALVTGAGGFLGGAIARLLLARGDVVRSFSRADYPDLRAAGIDVRRGELADPDAVETAVSGVDVVFHVASKAGIWGDEAEYRRTNVDGTAHIIEACRRQGVRKLVYTSTPSVVFDGGDMEGADESVPYATHFLAPYPQTKAEAERLVRAANASDLATVALRPHLIWGPGDNHLVPRILARARAGALRRIGRTDKRVDTVYIDDAAQAHLLAADRLAPGSPIAGKAYFITGGEPVPLWELVNRILDAGGLPPVDRTISPGMAYVAGCILETVYRLTGKHGEPRMTRFLARELSTAHWFDISAARRDLDYSPSVSIDEGMRRLARSLRQDHVDKNHAITKGSK
jgi:nucleoside-diphosphate-sugar epimerase